MRVVLDTHTWFWLETTVEYLSRRADSLIADADQLLVSPISCWELTQLGDRKRIQLDRDIGEWIEAALAQPRVTIADVTPAIAVATARLPWEHRDPADRIIVATAFAHDALVVTKDRRIHAFLRDRAIW
jgi:PIN domain nuclease of toxin-antitoxin system